MKLLKTIVLGCALILPACQTPVHEQTKSTAMTPPTSQAPYALESVDRSPQSESEVDAWVAKVAAVPHDTKLTPATCSKTLDPFLAALEKVDPRILVLSTASNDKLRDVTSKWLKDLFQARIDLRHRIPDLVTKGASDPCLKSIRRFLVYVRFAEEVLTESMVKRGLYPDQDADGQEIAFRGPFPATLVNAKYGKLEFKSGDVLLDRGDSAVSAQIARIGDVEHMFSHAMIVGESPTGKLYVIETTIQDIVGAQPLRKYWEDNADGRMAVYRHADTALARKAGRLIYDFTMKHKGSVPYDFHMNDQDAHEMFCAEVPQYAYRHASGGKVILPKYKTDISRFNVMGSESWIRAMEIPYDHIFAPSDIDVDPRFDLVAEYRYVPDLPDRRMDDAVMTSMYDWMLNKHYTFVHDLGDDFLANLGTLKAHLFGDDDIAPNMPKGSIKAALEFDRVFQIIRANLEPIEKEHYAKYGVTLSFQKMLKINEQFRQTDCFRYRQNVRDDAAPSSQQFMHMSFESDSSCPR